MMCDDIKSAKKQSPTQRKGNKAEELALYYLRKQGLKLLERQFKSKMGEVDLIMRKAKELIFVEVRSLQSTTYNEPYESITPQKKQRIIKTTAFYLDTRPWTEPFSVRFDVISISGDQPNPKITWIQDAFRVE